MYRFFVLATAILLSFASAVDLFGQRILRQSENNASQAQPAVQRPQTPTVPMALSVKPALDLHMCSTIDPLPSETGLRLTYEEGMLWDNGTTLRVEFLDGDRGIHEKVKRYATEWSNYANIKFDFINTGNPQNRSREADIRISFLGNRYQSKIGKKGARGVKDQNKPTMSLGFRADTTDVKIRETVLHEFGHALGMRHEHQSPAARIPWNEDKVYKFYKETEGWTNDETYRNVLKRYDHKTMNSSEFDASSIMLYPIDKELTTNGYQVPWNKELSAKDKEYIAMIYPKPGLAVVEIKIQIDGDGNKARQPIPGFLMINQDLDEGMSGWGFLSHGKSKNIYMFYRSSSSGTPITDLRISGGNTPAGFTRVPGYLNTPDSGDNIFLYYSTNTNKKPITEIAVRKDNDPFPKDSGWIRDDTNLNKGGGSRGKNIYLWYKRGITNASSSTPSPRTVSSEPTVSPRIEPPASRRGEPAPNLDTTRRQLRK